MDRTPRTPAPYHHGALRVALIDATEALLAEQGPDGFSLREVARRAGVSPAAPAHHFGDAAGLLTAVATLGFAGLTQALQAGAEQGGGNPRQALHGQGMAYVRYALQHPGRFRLMFRNGQLHGADAALLREADAAFEVLASGVRAAFGVASADVMQPHHWAAVTTLWSVVHGFAHLALAGKLGMLAGVSVVLGGGATGPGCADGGDGDGDGDAVADGDRDAESSSRVPPVLHAVLDATLTGLLHDPSNGITRSPTRGRGLG